MPTITTRRLVTRTAVSPHASRTVARTAPPTASEAPRRMMRVSRPAQNSEKENARIKALLDNHLQLIAYNDNRIAHLRSGIQEEILKLEADTKRSEAILEKTMKDANLKGYTTGEYEAKFETVMSRKSSTPRVADVKKALGDKVFMEIVTVPITALKMHMTQREIDDVCDVSTPVVTGTVFKVTHLVQKGKK